MGIERITMLKYQIKDLRLFLRTMYVFSNSSPRPDDGHAAVLKPGLRPFFELRHGVEYAALVNSNSKRAGIKCTYPPTIPAG